MYRARYRSTGTIAFATILLSFLCPTISRGQDNNFYMGEHEQGYYQLQDEGVQFAAFTYKGSLNRNEVERACSLATTYLRQKGTLKEMEGNGNTKELLLGPGKVLVIFAHNPVTGGHAWIACDSQFQFLELNGNKTAMAVRGWNLRSYDFNGYTVKMQIGRTGNQFTYQFNVNN